MGLTGKDKVLNFFWRSPGMYWRITDTDGNLIAAVWATPKKDIDNVSKEDSADHLRETLTDLDAGRYIFMQRDNENDQKNIMTVSFTIPRGAGEQTPERVPQQPATVERERISGFNAAFDFEQKINGIKSEAKAEAKKEAETTLKAAIKEIEYKRKIEDLERQLRESKEHKESTADKIGEIIDKYAPLLIQIFAPKLGEQAQAITGTPEQQPQPQQKEKNNMDENNAQNRFNTVIAKLQAIEPAQWLNILEAIVKLHDSDPATYNTAKTILLKS